jgi:ABC-type transport system substrate-binding protein
LLRRLAITNLVVVCLIAAIPARTARRPQYGGTLRVEIGEVVRSLDPVVRAGNPAEAAARNEIDSLLYESRDNDGDFSGVAGSGPFKVWEWEPGKRLALRPNETFREGRPFVNAVEINMGRAVRDRLLDLELNKVDLAPIPPQEARHAAERGVRVSESQPDELLALVFSGAGASDKRPSDMRAREAIALSIDRSAIVTFLLQKSGEPAGGLLPQWSSGTAFLFPAAADVARAKELWLQIAPAPKFVLGYDSADPLEQSIAERIVVNAKEAGIGLRAVSENGVHTGKEPDATLVRVAMKSADPATALSGLLNDIDLAAPDSGIHADALPDSASAQDIYDREREILNSYRVVPLVWLPRVYGLSARVRNWVSPQPGQAWPLADVWLDAGAQDTDTSGGISKDKE